MCKLVPGEITANFVRGKSEVPTIRVGNHVANWSLSEIQNGRHDGCQKEKYRLL